MGGNARLLLGRPHSDLVVERKPVEVRLIRYKPEALIQPVRRFTTGTRRQAHILCSALTGLINRSPIQRLPHTVASCSIIDDDIFNPCLQARGNAVEGQRQRPHNLAVVKTGNEQHRVLVVDNVGEFGCARRRRGRRELRNERCERLHQFVINNRCSRDRGGHEP